MSENTNLSVYNSLREVPKEAMKAFDNGRFKGTDINSMWRIKMLTETFGMVGFGWYYEVTKQWIEHDERTGTAKGFCNINLYVKDPTTQEWSHPIFGTGGNNYKTVTKSGSTNVNDEVFKMCVTDAIGNACKSLGMGADVYWANDQTKYTQEVQEPNFRESFDYITAIDDARTITDLTRIYNEHPEYHTSSDFMGRLSAKKATIK